MGTFDYDVVIASRDWHDGEVSPIARVAQTFAGEPDAVEWFFPLRLSLDVDAASTMRR